MQCEIVYILHNSFLVKFAGQTWLFDYPAPAHSTPEARAILDSQVAGARLTVFISHSHEDHFDPGLPGLLDKAASVRFVVSDDVADMYPGSVPQGSLVVEPDEEYEFSELKIRTLESNDLGVAFLIKAPELACYFGGDLAEWNWETLPPKAREMTEEFFREQVDSLAGEPIDLAFADVDNRLPGLAGGLYVLEKLAPRLFVPMHTFGDPSWLPKALDGKVPEKSRIFLYDRPGDFMAVDL